jgi:hypothetical protein
MQVNMNGYSLPHYSFFPSEEVRDLAMYVLIIVIAILSPATAAVVSELLLRPSENSKVWTSARPPRMTPPLEALFQI